MFVSLAVALLLLLSTSSMSTSGPIPLPEPCISLAATSCHINTTSSIIQSPHTASFMTSTTSTPSHTLPSYSTVSSPGSTNTNPLPSSASSSAPIPDHYLNCLLQPYSTTCHSNIDNTSSSTKSESFTKQSLDINTIVSIVFGVAQVLLSIWPTQAAWRFLHHHGHGGVAP